ncbi:Glucanase [Pleurostoma richardsiae]|uniref:Glucanase n=1 Tax=Pleurostoma richardsiae TaxID=41990 RepID=A0AA38RTH8_9PEZI|nr:Glucanase [Pleurostoma richardsiae]
MRSFIRKMMASHKPAPANPFDGKKLSANPGWAAKLEETYNAFAARGDALNAGKVRTIQGTGTFVWVSDRAGLANIDSAVAAARAEQRATGVPQIVGLVLYNLPDRDCSGGESSGELRSRDGGLEIYKREFVAPFAEKVGAAPDLTFAVVLEPDSLANAVTNQQIDFCRCAIPTYEEGIAYAIRSLQFEHVHLYIDAANGGWLGWDAHLEPAAKEFAKVVRMAGPGSRIRGFATNVSNFNPYLAEQREKYTEWSRSWDESHYVSTLATYLEAEGLPARFIIDQGRVALPGARQAWGEWCNVAPAGFGMPPGTSVANPYVDAIVWIKPGGESDGQIGETKGAPPAGQWFESYAEMLVECAHPAVGPS